MRSSDRLGGRPKDLHTHLHTHASIMSLAVFSQCLAYSRILRTAQGAWPPPMTLDHQSNLQPPDTVKVARQRWACRRPTARLGKGARLWLHCQGIRIGAFELWCWRRLLRVPWTARGYDCTAQGLGLVLLDCGVGEDSWESLGLQGDPTSPS